LLRFKDFLLFTLDTILPWSSFSVVFRESKPAGSLHEMHPPLRQIRYTIFQQIGRKRIHAGCLVVSQVSQRPFYFLTARQINVNSIISQIDWTCRSFRSSVLQNVLTHPANAWFLLVNSSPFLARLIATCGSNGRLTSLKRL
jgi:hypothetical protein